MTDQDHRHTAPKRPENPSGRNYADELSPLTDASIRDNATMLLKEIEYQLRRIGRNVNQIAHNANREMNATIEDEALRLSREQA